MVYLKALFTVFILSSFSYNYIAFVKDGFSVKECRQAVQKDTSGTKVLYWITIRAGENRFVVEDTLYVKGDFILESISKINYQTGVNDPQRSADSNDVSSRPIRRISGDTTWRTLTNYFISNWQEKSGMLFDVNKPPSLIKTYSIVDSGSNKALGYPLSAEVALVAPLRKSPQNHLLRQHDTLISNQLYQVYSTNHSIVVPNLFNNQPAVLKKAIFLLDPKYDVFCFPFISSILCNHFGGAVMKAHYYYENELEVQYDFKYVKGLSTSEHSLINQYKILYKAQKSALDTLPRLKN